MADTVTCTQQCYFYINDVLVATETYYEEELLPEYAYTPSHSSHMPPYDDDVYTSYRITYNGLNYTTGALTCPNYDFTVYFYFYGYEKIPVEEWDWSISNGSATAAQTRAAYEAITENGKTTDFSYLVWNDLVNKAKEVIEDRGGTWDTTYGSHSATLMSSTDKVMTAKRYNAVWWNLAQFINTGIHSAKVSGERMLGSHFIDLANASHEPAWA